MPQDENNEFPDLFIPTYPPPSGVGADTGLVRPVPNGVVYYLCWAIQPITTFQPGSSFTVQVTVQNWGGGSISSNATVSVWWSLPLSGTVIPDKQKFIGAGTVQVPSFGEKRTIDITGPIADGLLPPVPPGDPVHVCLLACVSHPKDMPPTTKIGGKDVLVADPVGDAHWAQHNLFFFQAVGPKTIQFMATNPSAEAARFDLVVQSVAREQWPALKDNVPGRPVRARAKIRLSGHGNGQEVGGDDALRQQITLERGEQRTMSLTMDLPDTLEPGTFAPFELVQLKSERPVGGFGIFFRPEI